MVRGGSTQDGAGGGLAGDGGRGEGRLRSYGTLIPEQTT